MKESNQKNEKNIFIRERNELNIFVTIEGPKSHHLLKSRRNSKSFKILPFVNVDKAIHKGTDLTSFMALMQLPFMS